MSTDKQHKPTWHKCDTVVQHVNLVTEEQTEHVEKERWCLDFSAYTAFVTRDQEDRYWIVSSIPTVHDVRLKADTIEEALYEATQLLIANAQRTLYELKQARRILDGMNDVKYAVGSQVDHYINGPFEYVHEALDVLGDEGDFIYRLAPQSDGSIRTVRMYKWIDGEWVRGKKRSR